MTKAEMIAEWHKADDEGRKWLAVSNHEKDNELNAIAITKMNACIHIKKYLQDKIGKVVIDEA